MGTDKVWDLELHIGVGIITTSLPLLWPLDHYTIITPQNPKPQTLNPILIIQAPILGGPGGGGGGELEAEVSSFLGGRRRYVPKFGPLL